MYLLEILETIRELRFIAAKNDMWAEYLELTELEGSIRKEAFLYH